MDRKIREQILEVRDTGRTNMFDIPMVQRIAYEMDHYDLVCWLDDHRAEYARFIMYGDEEEE